MRCVYRGYEVNVFPDTQGKYVWTVQNTTHTHSANGTAPTERDAKEEAFHTINLVRRAHAARTP